MGAKMTREEFAKKKSVAAIKEDELDGTRQGRKVKTSIRRGRKRPPFLDGRGESTGPLDKGDGAQKWNRSIKKVSEGRRIKSAPRKREPGLTNYGAKKNSFSGVST